MSHFKKELWMTPSGREGAIDCGAVDYVIHDATGLVRVVAKPIALSERQPVDSEKNENGQCYWGYWFHDSWHWMACRVGPCWVTHFLPAGVEVLPATCFAPEEA